MESLLRLSGMAFPPPPSLLSFVRAYLFPLIYEVILGSASSGLDCPSVLRMNCALTSTN